MIDNVGFFFPVSDGHPIFFTRVHLVLCPKFLSVSIILKESCLAPLPPPLSSSFSSSCSLDHDPHAGDSFLTEI